ncbi:MAG TPA: DUF3060 domain-containing protein [Kofleriaceae bacterium]|nr:DUF3060 domain-containing protein [Kofleriaceae bacterium]
MRPLGYLAFAALLVAIVGLFVVGAYATITAEDVDPPEVAARKAECKKLMSHVFELSPQRKDSGKSTPELVDAVPVEDLEQCAAGYPEVVACMQQAVDIDAVHACVPVTVECKGDKTRLVDDRRPIYELAGDCKAVEIATSRVMVLGHAADSLLVTGSDDHVRVDAVKSITASGARNHITWKLGKDTPPPTVVDKGTKNVLTGVE